MSDSSGGNDDVRDWFERGELVSCPRCGHADAAQTSIGSLYCLGCGELVDAPSEGPPPAGYR